MGQVVRQPFLCRQDRCRFCHRTGERHRQLEDYWREVSRLNIRTINFAYDQQVQTETGTSHNNHNVTIPLMAMVPIPYLRIDTMDLDFSVKLTGVEKTAVDRFSAKARAGYGGKKFGVTAAFAHRSSRVNPSKSAGHTAFRSRFEPAKARCLGGFVYDQPDGQPIPMTSLKSRTDHGGRWRTHWRYHVRDHPGSS